MNFESLINSFIPSTSTLLELLDWAILAVVAAIVIFLGVYFIRYNVQVVVRERLGDVGQRTRSFAARITYTKDKVPQLRFFNGLELKVPDRKFITNNQGVRFKHLIEFYKTGETANDLMPLKPTEDLKAINPSIKKEHANMSFEASDSEVLLWNQTKQKEKREKYNPVKWWHIVAPYAAIGIIVVIVFGSYFTVFEDLKVMHAKSADLLKQHDDKMLEIAKIMERTQARELESAMPKSPPAKEVNEPDGG